MFFINSHVTDKKLTVSENDDKNVKNNSFVRMMNDRQTRSSPKVKKIKTDKKIF